MKLTEAIILEKVAKDQTHHEMLVPLFSVGDVCNEQGHLFQRELNHTSTHEPTVRHQGEREGEKWSHVAVREGMLT